MTNENYPLNFTKEEQINIVTFLGAKFFNTVNTMGILRLNTGPSASKNAYVRGGYNMYEATGYLMHYLPVFGTYLNNDLTILNRSLELSELSSNGYLYDRIMKSNKILGYREIARGQRDVYKVANHMYIAFDALCNSTDGYVSQKAISTTPESISKVLTIGGAERPRVINELISPWLDINPYTALEITQMITPGNY